MAGFKAESQHSIIENVNAGHVTVVTLIVALAKLNYCTSAVSPIV